MKKKTRKFDKEYIDKAKNKIMNVIMDEEEYDDWTQICFSMKDAIEAARDVWGFSDDESIHKMYSFFKNMVLIEVENINKYDVTFNKKR